MERARILILGQTKENSFEIRNLLDNRRFELEIALNHEVGKRILTSRLMDLIVIHTESFGEETEGFFHFLETRGLSIPIMIVGEEAGRFRAGLNGDYQVISFEKPYPAEEMLAAIRAL